MTYPLSSDVTAGQPTAYQHYNYLRADALRFGQAETDSLALGELFSRFEDALRIEYLPTNRLRVPASPSAPVGLVIGGCLLKTQANVDLSAGAAPSGATALYFIFAARSPGSTSFTLDINTSDTESANTRRIGRFYWDGVRIVPGSIRCERGLFHAAQIGYHVPALCAGRLTLSPGTPVTGADVSAAGTLYFTPFRGGLVSLYSPEIGWALHPFSELSVSLAGKAADKNFDVFLCDLSGVLTLELVQWSGDTTRAAALSTQDGVLVKSGDPARRYLGSVRTSAAGQSEDSETRRFIWNYYNRVPRRLYKYDDTDNTYTLSTGRYYNNDSANQVGLMVGVIEDAFLIGAGQIAKISSATYNARVMVGEDGADGSYALGGTVSYLSTTDMSQSCAWTARIPPAAGYHSYTLVQKINTGTPTGTWTEGWLSGVTHA